MRRIFVLFSIILGSLLFFPVSCMFGLAGGTKIVAKLDERNIERGDEVHKPFSVVAQYEGSNGGKEITAFQLRNLESYISKEANEKYSFLMTSPNGTLDEESDSSIFSYHVLEDKGDQQIIEVTEVYRDGDNTIFSRYRATESGVFPISSKMNYFGYMFNALPFAFIFSVLLLISGRILKRRLTFSGKHQPLKPKNKGATP